MKIAAERIQTIAERKRPTERVERLWIRNSWETLAVHTVPEDVLVLNVENRRFRAERMLAEEQLGRALDPENQPDDERSIESLLLDTTHRVVGNRVVGKPSDDYEALRNDWSHRGQESPLWIRPDGTVRNGNRRLAMIRRLQREQGDSGLRWLDAVILEPGDIDEATLLEMEQREQLTANFKLRYNDIDYLLALREAAVMRDIEWFDGQSIQDVAGELQTMVEKSKGEVVRDLFAIKYMDIFLEISGQGGQYHRLLKTLEKFRDIGRAMMTVEEDYESDADRVLQVLFAAVRSGRRHGEIRAIRQMFRGERERFAGLAEKIAAAEDEWQTQPGGQLATPRVTDVEEQTEDDEDQEGLGPDVPNYPKAQVASAIEIAIDGFEASRHDDLGQILEEVISRLEILAARLPTAAEGAATGGLSVGLARIVAWADEHRHLVT